VYNQRLQKMSTESIPPPIDLGLDSYMSSTEIAGALYQYKCSLIAAQLGLDTLTIQRVSAFDKRLVDNLGPSMSQTRCDGLARELTAISAHLYEVPLDLYPDAAYAFNKTRNTQAVAAVGEIAKTSAVDVFAAEPGAVGRLAHGMANQWQYYDCNVKLVKDMAELGALQNMRDNSRGSNTLNTDMLFYQTQPRYNETTSSAIEKQRYEKHREDLVGLLRMPALGKLSASEAGKYMTQDLVSGFLVDRDYDIDAWRQNMTTLGQLVAHDETLANLDLIATCNPSLLSLLVPKSRDKGPIDIEHSKNLIAELATDKITGDIATATVVARHIPWSHRLHAVATAVSTNATRYVKGAEIPFAEWLSNDRDGDLEEKRTLLADAAFTKGLVRTFKAEWVLKLKNMDKTFEGKAARLLIDEALPDVAVSLKNNMLVQPNDWSFATQPYVEFYKRYGLDCVDLLETWARTGTGSEHKETARLKFVKDNLAAMIELENRQPGVCRKLQDDFFIRNFSRCSTEMWTNQYNNRHTAGERYFQVAISPEDHNFALDQFAKRHLGRLHRLAEGNGRHLRVYEPRSSRELLTSMFRSKQRYGAGMMEIGVLMAHDHGQPVSAQLGMDNQEHSILWDIRLAGLDGNTIFPKAKGRGGLAAIMAPNGSALVGSCASASEISSKLNLANAVAVALGAISFGPQANSYTGQLDFIDNHDGIRIGEVVFENTNKATGVISSVAGNKYNGPFLREEAVRAGLLR
jgi:hypothetical protein